MEQQPKTLEPMCKYCHLSVSPDDYFCPHCGKKLRDKPLATSLARQMVVYFVSFCFPPFGLPWAFRYLKQPDKKSKIVGWITIGLTIISLVITILYAYTFITSTTKQLNDEFNKAYSPIYTQ